MKKMILAALLVLSAFPAFAQIAPAPTGSNDGNSYNGYLANEAGLANSKIYTMDLAAYDAAKVSAQLVYSTITTTSDSLSDGQTCASSLTISQNDGLINPGGSVAGCGRTFVAGTDFLVNVTYSSMTAKNLKTALSSACSGLTVSQVNNTSIVYTTSTLDSLTACNFTPSNSYITAAVTRAGVNSAFALGSANISLASHGLSLGEAVLYSSAGANVTIGGLANQTTYYVYPVSGGTFQLMAYSTEAIAGVNGIVVTSTNTQTAAHTFTLAPLPWSGSATFIWQASNDNSSWATAPSTGTVTITNATAATDTLLDFGVFNFRYLRLNYTAQTAGLLLFKVPVNIKQDGIGRY